MACRPRLHGPEQSHEPCLLCFPQRRGARAAGDNGAQAVFFGERAHEHGDDEGWDDAQVRDAVFLDAAHEDFQVEAAHHVRGPPRFQHGRVDAGRDGGVEEGEGEEVCFRVGGGVWAGEHELVLRDEVSMRVLRCFGEASGPAGEQARGDGGGLRVQVVETHPVGFAVREEFVPGGFGGGHGLRVEDVEDPPFLDAHAGLVASCLHGGEDLGFGEDESDLGRFEVVSDFVRGVGWVGARKDAAGADDRKEY